MLSSILCVLVLSVLAVLTSSSSLLKHLDVGHAHYFRYLTTSDSSSLRVVVDVECGGIVHTYIQYCTHICIDMCIAE